MSFNWVVGRISMKINKCSDGHEKRSNKGNNHGGKQVWITGWIKEPGSSVSQRVREPVVQWASYPVNQWIKDQWAQLRTISVRNTSSINNPGLALSIASSTGLIHCWSEFQPEMYYDFTACNLNVAMWAPMISLDITIFKPNQVEIFRFVFGLTHETAMTFWNYALWPCQEKYPDI